MYKQFTRRALSFFVAAALVVISPFCLAGKADFDMPVKVVSKSQRIDGLKETSRFWHDVRISQGSLLIEADEVEVIAAAGKGKEIIIARGSPAIYSQQMDDGSSIKAQASEIKYQLEISTISLTGNAELQRDTSMVKGDSITFDMVREQLQAEGGDNNDGRVTTIFGPEHLPNKKAKEKKEQKENNN